MPEGIFGTAYLDAVNFRASAALFGVGMAFCDYPATEDGNAKLDLVLQAASRAIDAHCGKSFSTAARTERHILNADNFQTRVNNPPVSEVTAYKIIFDPGSSQTFQVSEVFINNQLGYVELCAIGIGIGIITQYLATGLVRPVVEISYKSFTDVPKHVALACGFQAAHHINNGFVDKMLPPNFGKLDMGGLSINNKKGYRNAGEMRAGALSAEAERLLSGEVKFSAA